MNETAVQPRPAEEGGTLSRKRRTALIAYLAILFAVAFLVVALSMILENRKLRNSNQALEDSNRSASASSATALEKAEALQDENRRLSETIAAQEDEKQQLLADAAAAQAEKDAALAEREPLAQENERLSQENEALTAKQKETARVLELLCQAIAAERDGLQDEFVTAMRELAPLTELLPESGKPIYDSLLESLPEE